MKWEITPYKQKKLTAAGLSSLPVLITDAAMELVERAPLAWQKVESKEKEVGASYMIHEDASIGFVVGDYDRSLALVIDPDLEFSTFLGGSNEDFGRGIAVSGSGEVYVTGCTISTDFPTVAPLQPFPVGRDIFVAKFSADGSQLLYSTYL
ncbi:MAG: SBBP repeat-containing protein, partial [Acidobacteriota bacterium]